MLVGRERELAQLTAAMTRVRAGEPAMVLVAGEAGIGKSRLLRQFVDALSRRVWVGHCPPVGDGLLPYAPVIEVFRCAAQELGAQAFRERAGAVWPRLTRLLPELGDATTQPAVASSQAAQWAELTWLVNRLTDEPTVLVIEDIHWADPSTRGLVNLLARGTGRHLLLVCTYRDDELAPAHPLRQALAEWHRAGMETIRLARLDRDEVLGQVSAITRKEPDPGEIDELFRRSGGNPFFVEELLVAGPHAQGLPEGLRDLLLMRVRQLSPVARQAVRVVAVAGHSASHALLSDVLDIGRQELAAGLDDAVTGHIMVASAETYAFGHVLVGEAVVADLLPGERIRLHRLIAEALDRRLTATAAAPPTSAGPDRRLTATAAAPPTSAGPDRWLAAAAAAPPTSAGPDRQLAATAAGQPGLLAEIAHHWLATGDAARALASAVQAGLAAENTFALPEAHSHFLTALGLWEKAGQAAGRVALDLVGPHQHAAETAYLLDDLDAALALVQQGLEHADAAADPMRAGLLHERLGKFMLASGKPAQATLDAYQRAVYLVPDEATQERARVLAGFSAMVLGSARHDEAAAWARQAVHTARRAGARHEEARG